jgi:hypothetical protein
MPKPKEGGVNQLHLNMEPYLFQKVDFYEQVAEDSVWEISLEKKKIADA